MMNISELVETLEREGVKPRAYDLEGSRRDEVYCLEPSGSGWVVYYRERGIMRDETFYASEDEACRQFLEQVLRDATTRQ